MTTTEQPLEVPEAHVPGAIARERAARATKKANDLISSSGKNTMMLPGGLIVDVTEHMDFRYDFKQNWWLGEPHKLLKHPKPPESGYTYGWARRVNAKGETWPETAAKLRAGYYRSIEPEEILDHTHAEIGTHKGANGDQVMWADLVLVEIVPEQRRKQYDIPQAMSLTRFSAYEENFANDVEQLSGGKAVATSFQPEGESQIAGLTKK